MFIFTAMSLLMCLSSSSMEHPWPQEEAALDRSQIESKWRAIPNGRTYSDGVLSLEMRGSTSWAGSLERYWRALPSSGTVFLDSSIASVDRSGVVIAPEGNHAYRYYRMGSLKARMDLRAYGDSAAASRALADAGKDAQEVIARVRDESLGLGDECQVRDGQPSLEFRIGRFLFKCHVSSQETPETMRACVNLARAAAFRLYSSGVAGEPETELVLATGTRIPALQIGTRKFVSVTSLRPFLDSVGDAPVGGEPGHVLVRGANRVEARAYTLGVRHNGLAKPSAAPIPYAGDLWVPYDPAVKSLGL